MKTLTHKIALYSLSLAIIFALFSTGNSVYAGKDSTATKAVKVKTVKNTFAGNLIIDNQSVMVPVVKTFEFTIQHRFGTINNGYSDFYGLFSGAMARFGWNYTPIANLQVGLGLCEDRMQWDGNIKYAISKQAVSGGCPVSTTYFGNMAISTLPKKENFISNNDRISYFNELIVARRVTDKLSLQIAPSLSYFNNVEGYIASDETVKAKMNNAHIELSAAGKYNLTGGMAVMVNYDQPITQHLVNNPHPNVAFGLIFATISHTFSIFATTFDHILAQNNNMYNQNDFKTSRYCIGFNITKRWNLFAKN